MENDYSDLLREYPEIISADQLYRICKISKRKAKWLLDNGIIPCHDTGKVRQMKRSKVYFNLAPIGQYSVQQIGIGITLHTEFL